MSLWFLLALTTVFYAAYNLCIKVSGTEVSGAATTTIAATICLQVSALAVSAIFASALLLRGGHVLALPTKAYLWAAIAGLAIGSAEIAYFYVFSGIDGVKPLDANVAIPTVVAGTIVITMIASTFFSWRSVRLAATAWINPDRSGPCATICKITNAAVQISSRSLITPACLKFILAVPAGTARKQCANVISPPRLARSQ